MQYFRSLLSGSLAVGRLLLRYGSFRLRGDRLLGLDGLLRLDGLLGLDRLLRLHWLLGLYWLLGLGPTAASLLALAAEEAASLLGLHLLVAAAEEPAVLLRLRLLAVGGALLCAAG